MKKMILFLSVAAFSTFANATTRADIQGDSQKEREIRWVWKYLREFTQSCALSESDCQEPQIKKLIEELNAYLPYFEEVEAKNWNELLVFTSEKINPDLFKSDKQETHRIAVTEFKKFSKIYINTDRMNLPLQNWVGLLVHEALHHLGHVDDQARSLDKTGSEVGAHFQKRAQTIDLALYGREDLTHVIFNSKAPRATVGFLSWAQRTFDVDWVHDTLLQPVCSGSETITKQFVGSPSWRVNRISSKTGLVTVRGGGFVNVECTNVTTGSKAVKRALIGAGINLKYPLPFDKNTFFDKRPEILIDQLEMGPSLDPSDSIGGPNQSFWITSMKTEEAILSPTQIWKTQIIVKSIDGFAPKGCEIYFTALKWSFWKQNNMQAPAIFNHCTLKALENSSWQIDADFTFPPNMQSDDFFISLIRFPDSAGDRFAIPIAPAFITVENPQAAKPAEIKNFQVLDPLKPALTFADMNLKNSFLVAPQQKINFKIIIDGNQKFTAPMVDLDFWMPRPGGYQMLNFSGSITEMPQIFTGAVAIKTASGTEIQLTVSMPSQISQFPVVAMKIRRLFMQTSDFSWTEFESSEMNDFILVSKP